MKNNKPVWHGVVLVAGGAIGAGMFALPVVSSGMWFGWATLGLIAICLCTYLAALVLLEVNLQFPPGSSFHTIVRDVLGNRWAWANNICIAFIMFILMYAYITAGAGIIEYSIRSLSGIDLTVSRGALSVGFALTIGILVWLGTSMVSRASTILMLGMVIAFVYACTKLGASGATDLLIPRVKQPSYIPYIWEALPVYVTAFACAGLVPSLVKHYPGRPINIRHSLLFGCLIVLLVYVVWVGVVFSALPRSEFVQVIQKGGNVDVLVSALRASGVAVSLNGALDWFSHFAIVTSFLSIGLGLFHFLIDGLDLGARQGGRIGAALLTFLPPALMSFFFPYGFITAIGMAGLLVAFSFFVVPALMSRRRFGWTLSNGVILLFGIFIALLKIASLLGVLPNYGA